MQCLGLDAAAVNMIMPMMRLAMTGRAPAAGAFKPFQAHVMHTIRCQLSICTVSSQPVQAGSAFPMQNMLGLVLQCSTSHLLLGMHDTSKEVGLKPGFYVKIGGGKPDACACKSWQVQTFA